MTKTEFCRYLSAELKLRSVPHKWADVWSFVNALWHWIADDPSPNRWASTFVARLEESNTPEEMVVTR